MNERKLSGRDRARQWQTQRRLKRQLNTGGRDRWVLSYADFITLLFAFFVALYSISLKQAGDERQLTQTLQGIFDAVQKSIKPINIGDPVAEEANGEQMLQVTPDESFDPTPNVISNVSQVDNTVVYKALSDTITSQFPSLQRSGDVTINEDPNWITLDMKSGLLFAEGESELSNEAVALLIAIANILQAYPSPILVLGNTDDTPTTGRVISSNWHLSALRAAAVVDELIYRGINPKLLAPVGFSSENPQVRNTNDYARAQNRRVTLKISKQVSDNLHDYLFN
ncbi:flagellar motor protein [Maribrevibacterium harenarium]|uniref:Flagellar motor protein n=1 Tax=Maribrevibacterium harenarium TaxID=2589817 RepID=A0A501X2K4_9GAMM|nr:flagellar motor protein MotB [Maribrevibacterium harenarium]TPE54721.1 flagellar motor protein [Maribrevibacterium harenarium]